MAIPNLRTPTSYNGQKSTTHKFGAVRLATEAEATAQVMNDVALTPATAVLAIPAATTTVEGKVRLATDAEAVTGSLTTNVAINPGSLTARLAAPGPIGGTTPAAGDFTTLDSTGAITAGTTLTATLGDITATNGDLVLGTAGNKVSIATGADASVGTSAAMTAGAITVATTAVTASSIIFVSHNTLAGTPGAVSAPTGSIVAGTSFDIVSSSNTDTSTVNWWIVN